MAETRSRFPPFPQRPCSRDSPQALLRLPSSIRNRACRSTLLGEQSKRCAPRDRLGASLSVDAAESSAFVA
eukprot:179165-Pleurochrysis_carterae.AAC.1